MWIYCELIMVLNGWFEMYSNVEKEFEMEVYTSKSFWNVN